MVAYSVGYKIKVSTSVLEANELELDVFSEYVENGCVVAEILRLVKGRTWLIALPDGTEIECASKNFKGVVATGG